MDENSTATKSRRSFIKRAALLVGVTIVPSLATIAKAFAFKKLSKTEVQYQDEPKAGKDCDDCVQFITGATPKARGTCKVVEGVSRVINARHKSA